MTCSEHLTPRPKGFASSKLTPPNNGCNVVNAVNRRRGLSVHYRVQIAGSSRTPRADPSLRWFAQRVGAGAGATSVFVHRSGGIDVIRHSVDCGTYLTLMLTVGFGVIRQCAEADTSDPASFPRGLKRKAVARDGWVVPAPTKSGHLEKSTLKKQHKRVCKRAQLEGFTLYAFRYACLTRWAEYMDAYTLAYLAGHSDFATTKRYVHPQTHTVQEAIERARNAQGGTNLGTLQKRRLKAHRLQPP